MTWQYHVFSLEDLQAYFEVPNGTFRTKIRADNDTDNSFSTLTAEMTIAIPDQLPFVNLGNWTAPSNTCTDTSTTTTTSSSTTSSSTTLPPAAPNAPTNTSVNYQGEDVFFNWEYTAGQTDLVEFHINYSYDNQTWTRIVIDDVDARSYTLDKSFIQTGVFYWEIASCGDVSAGESCATGDSNNFKTTEYVAPTTTTLPPAPVVEVIPEPEPEPEPIVEVIIIGGEEVEFTETEIADGTVEREQERAKNLEELGCEATDAQVARGDCGDIDIFADDENDETLQTDIFDSDEFDENMQTDIFDPDELTDGELEELEELEKEIEKQIIEDLGAEFFDGPVEDLSEEELVELEELVDSIIFIQENVNFDDFVVLEEDPEFLDDLEFEDEIIIVIPEDDKKEEVEPIIEIFDEDEVVEIKEEPVVIVEEVIAEVDVELSEEEVVEIEEAVVELVEVIEASEEVIPEVPDEIIEDLTEEQVDVVVESYVETLEVETKVEIIEDVVEVGIEDLTDEQVTVVAAVVESAIEDVEVLDEEQVETVAEVLGLDDSTDVAVIAENAKEDEAVAEAVDSYVERAASEDNADVEDYNFSDAVVEVQTEEFLENPAVIFQVDLEEISFAALDEGMSLQQKEKSQEVVVPVIIASQIVSAAVVPYRRIR
mgnify:CR=1 FL=1